jgi:hypothetical protein
MDVSPLLGVTHTPIVLDALLIKGGNVYPEIRPKVLKLKMLVAEYRPLSIGPTGARQTFTASICSHELA